MKDVQEHRRFTQVLTLLFWANTADRSTALCLTDNTEEKIRIREAKSGGETRETAERKAEEVLKEHE